MHTIYSFDFCVDDLCVVDLCVDDLDEGSLVDLVNACEWCLGTLFLDYADVDVVGLFLDDVILDDDDDDFSGLNAA